MEKRTTGRKQELAFANSTSQRPLSESAMDHQTLEQRLLRYVGRSSYKPVKPRVIARKLNLSDKQHRDLKRAIKRLVRRGELR